MILSDDEDVETIYVGGMEKIPGVNYDFDPSYNSGLTPMPWNAAKMTLLNAYKTMC